MSEQSPVQAENRLSGLPAMSASTPERALKNFRYVVGAVNDDALRTWAELCNELQQGVTPGGLVLPEMSKGFTPPCGWPEFLEKFWLLKHYLDYTRRVCQEG
jgi:hypothetical protein